MLRGETGLPRSLATTLRHGLDDPHRRFWPIVGLITLGGVILRALIHDFGLPWFDSPEELILWNHGLHVRDITSPYRYYLDFTGIHPPLMLWLHQLAQPLAEARGRLLAADAALDLRRLVLVFNALGGVWFTMLGRRCGGALAGIIAAALWAFEPRLLSETVYAISASLIIPLQVLALLLAVYALESPRRWWLALASVALGTLCFLGDYRWLAAVIPGLAALLWLAWRRFRPAWRLALLWSIAALAIGGGLLLTRLPLSLQGIARETLTTHVWDFEAHFHWLRITLYLIHPALFLLFLVLVLLTLRSRRATRAAPLSTPALLMVGATMVLTMWAITSIRLDGDNSFAKISLHHQLPTLLMLYLLLATAVAYLLPRVPGARARNLVSGLFVTCLLLVHLLPSLQLVQRYRVPPWPLIVRRWADVNLESSNMLIYPDSDRWFDPVRGGIPIRFWFNTRITKDIREQPLKVWVDHYHFTWALIPARAHDELSGDAEGQALLDQMLLVREFTAPSGRRRAKTLLYRLWRMQHETDVRLGEHIRLTGYDLHTPVAGAGDNLEFTFYWNARSTPPENLSLFLHLVADDDPRLLAQIDGNPAVPARLTQTWNQPTETLISPRFSLSLPADLAPGDYRILLGLYNLETGARLPVRDASGAPFGDALELLRPSVNNDGTVTVREAARAAQ